MSRFIHKRFLKEGRKKSCDLKSAKPPDVHVGTVPVGTGTLDFGDDMVNWKECLENDTGS